MLTLPDQDNLNEFTQPVISVTEEFSFADQQFNSITGSVADSQLSDCNSMFDVSVTPPEANDMSWDMYMKISDDDKLLNPKLGFGFMDQGSMALTDPQWEQYPTLGDGGSELLQQFNSHVSQLGIEDEAWYFEPDPSHLDHAGRPLNEPVGKAEKKLSEGWNGKKRKSREPIIITQGKQADTERMKRKREADKKYRAELKMELKQLRTMKLQYDKLMTTVSRFGGIVQMVTYINHSIRIHSELLRLQPEQDEELEAMSQRPELMKRKHGGIENMGSILLDKFKDMVAESRKLNEMKSKLGIQEIESIVEKFKEMEVELKSLKQKLHNQEELESFPFPLSPGTRQQKEMYEGQVEDFNRFEELMSKFGGIEKMEYMLDKFPEMEIELNSLKQREDQLQLQQESYGPGNLQSGTMTELQYSDVVVDQFTQSLTDDNVVSNSDDLDNFNDLLEGDREIVGKYKIPTPLVSTAQNILNVYGDITRKSKYSVHAVQNIFVLFCAAIKEMSDRSLELVTEDIMWKLRDPIMDAKRSEFDVEFAIEYLKTIAQGYFGLKARRDFNNLKQTVARLRADEEALRQELEKKSQEIKATETRQRDLTSEKCRICQESANKIMYKTASLF